MAINFGKDRQDVINAARKYKNLKIQIKSAEAELDKCKAVILDAMGDNDTAICKASGVYLEITNKIVKSTRVDVAKVKAAFPDWEKRFGSTTENPRFTVK